MRCTKKKEGLCKCWDFSDNQFKMLSTNCSVIFQNVCEMKLQELKTKHTVKRWQRLQSVAWTGGIWTLELWSCVHWCRFTGNEPMLEWMKVEHRCVECPSLRHFYWIEVTMSFRISAKHIHNMLLWSLTNRCLTIPWMAYSICPSRMCLRKMYLISSMTVQLAQTHSN